ncbi:MAG: hypothetical protein QNL01_03955 [Akkermansiaceae bacterium]
MADWQRLTATEQLTAHLRGELLRGRWVGTMPGVQTLGAFLADTKAEKRLLDPQGAGGAFKELQQPSKP